VKVKKIVRLPDPVPDADAANAERNQRLFDWASTVLSRLGLDRAVRQAQSIEELRSITLNVDDAALAICDALHPASGERAEHFRGLPEGGLKRILRNRLADLKKDREKVLRQRGAKQRDWSDDLILNDNGTIKPNLANLTLILREAPAWKHVLGFDEFAARVVIRGRPPWGEESPDAPWTDHYEALVRVWFQRDVRINPSMGDVGRAVQTAAKHNSFHPVREYFEQLVWDGVPRLETWLETYFHAEKSAYVRAIGPRYLISAVARIYRPGCKADHLIVLEGPQGRLKTEALRTLAIRDAWFTDRLSPLASKDAAQELSGVLLIEISEMDALARSSSSTAKSFLSRLYDRFRPPYGKHTVSRLRQCVFAGTINPPAGGYLKDPTGARRFWPVACCGMIDRHALEVDRDQLWAEAVRRFEAGESWWLETPELEALATAEQAARFAVDVWEEPIRKWLGDRVDVSISDVLQQALGFPREQHTQSAQNRVVRILTHLGYSRHRPRTPEGRQQRYQRDAVPSEKSDD
jgi:predicted P-loop ATPase